MVKLHFNNYQIFGFKAVLKFKYCSIKIICQLLNNPKLLKYINIIHSLKSKWILIKVFKDKDRLVFTLNKVVNRSYNNSLRYQRPPVLIIQTRVNKSKEEIRIVQYLLPKVVITHALDKAKRNRWLLRCNFIFMGYKKNKRPKEVLKTVKNYILINRIFILIQLCNAYLSPYSGLSLITKCLKVRIEFKALLICIGKAIRLSERII